MFFYTTKPIFRPARRASRTEPDQLKPCGCINLSRQIQDSLYWTCGFNRLASRLALRGSPSGEIWIAIPVIGQAVTSLKA